MERYREMEKYHEKDPNRISLMPSHPQKYPLVGFAPRRFDHFNVMANDVQSEQEWLTREMGIKHRYYVEGDDGKRRASWLSLTNLSHDIAVMRNYSGVVESLLLHFYVID